MKYTTHCPNCDPFGDCGECVCGFCQNPKRPTFFRPYSAIGELMVQILGEIHGAPEFE